jgi:1,4-dihydroxy-2-naphthoate octaprenyltransferase
MVLEKLYFPALASTFMIGGVYPLTQIYQHQEDYENGDITISLLLGYKGTFVFSIIMFFCAGICLFVHFEAIEFLIFQVFLAPVAFFFVKWMLQVWKDASNANFENTMKMNTIASICMNLCFIFLAIKTILHF